MPWAIGKLKKNPYFWQNKKNEKDFHFNKILIKNDIIYNKNYCFGLHGFIHEAFPLEDKETRNLILKKGIDAAKDVGINIETFVPPFNMAFNNNEGDILDDLRKNNIKTLRIAGYDDYYKTFIHERKVTPSSKKNGINIVHLSSSIEGTYSENKIDDIINNIKNFYSKNKIFCIMSHDYSFKTNDNLFLLYNKIMKLKENYKIKFTNLKSL